MLLKGNRCQGINRLGGLVKSKFMAGEQQAGLLGEAESPRGWKEPYAVKLLWGAELADSVAAIDDFETRCGPLPLPQKPAWLLFHHSHELHRLGAFIVIHGKAVRGFAPFILQQHPLRCYVGEFKLLQFKLRCLRFLGRPVFPDEHLVYEQMFTLIEGLPALDGIFVEGLPTESFLSHYLESESIGRRFIRHGGKNVSQHCIAAIPGSYEEYARKFSSKTRSTLGRRIRKLEKAGGKLVLERATDEADVERFVENAVAVSKKTYQWHLLGLGLRNADLLKRELKFLARRGWARCYLLWCGETPTAFMLCYQDHASCYYIDVGFDSDWSDYSPGTVLQIMVLQDLFTYRTPAAFDFGGMAEHKKFFANTSYPEVDLCLLRRRTYPLLASAVSRTISGGSDWMVGFLDRVGLKRTIKAWFRRSSVSKAPDQFGHENERITSSETDETPLRHVRS